ncbi:YceI family protein [Labrenzia sp. PHM005]|uniref:YceI family protein n=1 Tax=Labrenzia sp. PHM005 TaxID=2590016 RepID=UPI00113FD596|nr:YceI family protein [Labrenzia sp. PHM005]QDG77002.1 YceI family protein [Labrenzia sp. PHM005]
MIKMESKAPAAPDSASKRTVQPAVIRALVFAISVFASCTGGLADVLSGRYVLPAQALEALFSVGVLGGKQIKGRFEKVKGEMVLNAKKPEASRVNVTVDLRSVKTGNDRVTGFLKSAAMFNVSKYPTARFESYSVRLTGKKTAKVEGYLTMRGARQRTSLDVHLQNTGNTRNIAIQAEGGFFRSLYGMDAGLPLYADKVRLQINGTGKRY